MILTLENNLLTIFLRYEMKDVYNDDEFGLFYQALPNESLHFQGKHCSGGTHSKIRLTWLVAGSTTGEKLPMFVIGKSIKPRCFSDVKSLPYRYRSQKRNLWMGIFYRLS